jgi:hypothetical protein
LAAVIAAFLLSVLNMGIGSMGIGSLHPIVEEDHHFVKTLKSFADKKNKASFSGRQRQETEQQQQPQPLPPTPPSLPLASSPPPPPPLPPPASPLATEIAFPREPVPRPPLDTIIQGWNITGDPSWLLNFAILGFPKCGTSTMMHHLSNHSQIQMFNDERCEMASNQEVPLIRDWYNKLPAGDYVRGIKCPMDLENTKLSMRNYQKVFPKTNYIVGLRHPVLWFESFYNFRVHNKVPMAPADELIGRCMKKNRGLCTFRGNFHLFLSNLNKTNITDPNEIQYIGQKIRRSMDPLPRTKQKVFLYDVRQLSDSDSGREAQLLTDLQSFLGLHEPISPMIWFKPGKKHENENTLKKVNEMKINICDEKYIKLRDALMEQSINASRWISQYFIHAPDVFVSSKEHFSSVLMKSWERDPCLDRATKPIS